MNKVLHSQTGKAESKAPITITLIIIALLGFLAYKFVPVKWKYVKFNDELQELLNINYAKEYKQAARGAFNEYTMRDNVLKLAEKHKIPIEDADRQVLVRWPDRRIFTVTIDYQETIKLPVYGPYIWEFHIYIEQDPMSGKAI